MRERTTDRALQRSELLTRGVWRDCNPTRRKTTMATMFRGVPIVEPPKWTRGQTPAVEYTNRPLNPPEPPKLSRPSERKRKGADARLRRALIDAWRDPARARSDLHAAGAAYADLDDAQGASATFYLAHVKRSA